MGRRDINTFLHPKNMNYEKISLTLRGSRVTARYAFTGQRGKNCLTNFIPITINHYA